MLVNAALKVLEDFPKLYIEYTKRINDNYTFVLMNMYSDTELGYSSVHISMKNRGDTVTLFSFKGINDVEELSINENSEESQSSSQGLKLSSAAIFDKSFKKSILGGYKMEEVDGFLDMIIEDYRTFERHISKY